ncbi:MAG: 23S rRNA (adenine(2503)-C(2))-methyltransferase RlmN [Rhodobacterales bacterium]|nr:23S rRNA (adenine(2503)-C(2))-methyltransferase RlmN [Rhodobacterales bacterium]
MIVNSPQPLPGTTVARLLRDDQGRLDLKALDRAGVERFVQEHCDASLERGRAVYQAMWQGGALHFEDMVGVRASIRKKLTEVAFISTLEQDLRLVSEDGTIKYLWRLQDGHMVESVLIPDGDRLTLCMSSQVGCAMACMFCLTGDLGLKRNMTAAEIANQPLQVLQDLPKGVRITNLVLMGMGEPLHNLNHLTLALSNCLDDYAMKFSHRRVTVSTVGLVNQMGELAARLPVNLAVSLNATTEAQRREIMPITRKHSMAELLQACRDFPLPTGKRITFEYVMFRGFNDTAEDAERLCVLLAGIPAKVNLLPYNENPSRDMKAPFPETVDAFRAVMLRHNMVCHVRKTRGQDISAACGQLGKARQQATDGGWVSQPAT